MLINVRILNEAERKVYANAVKAILRDEIRHRYQNEILFEHISIIVKNYYYEHSEICKKFNEKTVIKYQKLIR